MKIEKCPPVSDQQILILICDFTDTYSLIGPILEIWISTDAFLKITWLSVLTTADDSRQSTYENLLS